MLEYEMIFGLGFCTAGLLALACLPAVWRRALRLTSYRLRQLVPLSSGEIAAEHAGIRAQAAVEQRRLEQHVADGEAKRSELMAELGRRDVNIAAVVAAAARDARAYTDQSAKDAGEIAELANGLDSARREVASLSGQMGGANIVLHDLEILAEQRFHELAEARDKAQDLQRQINEDRASIAAFETRVLGLDTRVADLIQALDKATADGVRTAAAARQASIERDEARGAASALGEMRDTLNARIERLSAQLAQGDEGAAIAGAQADTIADLRAQLAMQSEAARASAQMLEAMRSEMAGLRAPPGPDDASLDALRDAIRRVADDVLKLTATASSD